MQYDEGAISVTESFLLKANELDPENVDITDSLASFYQYRMLRSEHDEKISYAAKALRQHEILHIKSDDKDMNFYRLNNLASTAYESGEYEKAEQYSEQLIEKASSFLEDWNYGNAIHDGNQILGLLALHADDNEGAKLHLISAGETPGSPQLDSYGPSMKLAHALLKHGEVDTVLDYLKRCSRFWHSKEIEKWINEIESGQVPNFGSKVENL